MPDLVSGAPLSVSMKLAELMKGIAAAPLEAREGAREITGLCYDSQKVQQGFLFVAIPGSVKNGHLFIPEAIQKGAAAVVVQKPVAALPVPQVAVSDSREALARLAARFYEEPSRHLRLLGITGTNGKTTLTFLLESILREAGRIPGVVGTINYRYQKIYKEAKTTTPESLDLQALFAEMLAAGVTDVVMEVSSHSLAQGRVRNLHFDGVAFTNLSRDHLDYHQDLERYFAAKSLLFTDFLPASAKREKFAVLNMEDPRSQTLLQRCPEKKIRVGLTGPYEISAPTFELSARGIEAEICVEGEKVRIHSPLLGQFNLENILVAVGLAHGIGIPLDKMVQGLEKVKTVPGRLESIPNRQGIGVFVDYAHTPEALARVGAALRPFCKGRLLTVFGCGGDRDAGKRPQMGSEVAKFSDLVIVTSDNPRTEDPEKIIAAILPGLAGLPTTQVQKIADRKQAIHKALELARPGDFVLIAGKGHEDYQIIGTTKTHFSDQEVVREFLV